MPTRGKAHRNDLIDHASSIGGDLKFFISDVKSKVGARNWDANEAPPPSHFALFGRSASLGFQAQCPGKNSHPTPRAIACEGHDVNGVAEFSGPGEPPVLEPVLDSGGLMNGFSSRTRIAEGIFHSVSFADAECFECD